MLFSNQLYDWVRFRIKQVQTPMTYTRLQRLFVSLAALALLALSGLATVQAQRWAGPVVLNLDGDLWAWEGAGQPLTQLTDWGFNGNPLLSPDGTRIAYTSYASIFTDWLQTVRGAGGFLPPENIWILDLPSRQTFRVAGQPLNAEWNGPEQAGTYTLRQGVTWSPDSQQLAWVDLRVFAQPLSSDQYTNTVEVAVHDLVSNRTRMIDTFEVTGPSRRSGSGKYNLSWAKPGIFLEIRPDGENTATQYRLYDPFGGMIEERVLEGVAGVDWIHYQDQYYRLYGSRDTGMDWATGESGPITENPVLYSLTAPDGATFHQSGDNWILKLPADLPYRSVELGDDVQPYGISRDGRSGLYGRYEIDPATGFYAYTVIAHSESGPVEIGRYQKVQAVWGPVGWRVAD
jgi:hypothetical protein